MHGNVWEWCEDIWHDNYDNAPDDGSAWLTEGDQNCRVLRGGSWASHDNDCRSAFRLYSDSSDLKSDIGFRVVVSAEIS
jgi:formylglycine-generating enzyme required for sulfatase activity